MKFKWHKSEASLVAEVRTLCQYATILTWVPHVSPTIITHDTTWNKASTIETIRNLKKEIKDLKQIIRRELPKVIKEIKKKYRGVVPEKLIPIYSKYRPTGRNIIRRWYSFLEWDACPDDDFVKWWEENQELAKNNIKYQVLNFKKYAIKYIRNIKTMPPWELEDLRKAALTYSARAEWLINNPVKGTKEPDYNVNVHWKYITPFKSFYR